MKLLKWLLWLVGGLAVLLVVAVVLIMLLVDPNDYKAEIAALVKDKTGRDLVINGDIDLTFFSGLGAEVHGLVLGNAPGFGQEPMATVDAVQASVRLLPLLSGDIEIGAVLLEGVVLSLARNAEGATNWDDLIAVLSNGQAGPADQQAPDQQAPGQQVVGQPTGALPDQAGSVAFSLAGLEVRGLSLAYADQRAGTTYGIADLDLSVGAVEWGDPFDFILSLAVEADAPQLAGAVKLSGTAGLDLDAERYEIAGLSLDADLHGEGVPGGQTVIALHADRAQADLAARTALLDGFRLAAYGAEATGSLMASNILDAPSATGTIALAPFDLKATLAALGQEIVTSDPDALTSVAVNADFLYAPDSLRSSGLKLVVDQTTLAASLDVAGFERPAVTFQAEADVLDLDRYLPPTTDQAGGQETQPATVQNASVDPAVATDQAASDQAVSDQAASNPVDFLRDFDLDGTASIGRLKLSGGEFTDITLTVRLKDGVLDLESVTLSLYGGQAAGAYTLDARPEVSLSTARLSLSRVHMGPALQAFFGKAYVSGDLNLKTTEAVTFQGLDEDGMLRTLNGAFSLDARNGVLPAGGVAAQLVGAASLLLFTSGRAAEGDNVAFDSITGYGTIEQGVIKNPMLLMKSPSIWARGGGIIDLNRSLLDYQATAKLVSNPDADEDFDDVTAPEVAVYASGPLSDPVVDTGVIEGLGNLGLNIVSGVGEDAGDLVQGVTGLDLGIGSDEDEDEKEDTTFAEDVEEVLEDVGDALEDLGESLGIF